MREPQQDRYQGDELSFVSRIAREYIASGPEVQITELGGGDCNVIYLVTTSEKKIVVKLSKPDRESKALEGYRKERWCMAEACKLGVRTPEVIDVDQKYGRAYMIQSFLEGASAADLQGISPFHEEEKQRVWRILGVYARQIHAIPVNGYGDTMVHDGVFAGSWIEHLHYNIDSLHANDVLIRRGILTSALSGRIRTAFVALAEKEFRMGLSHADIALRNVIVAPSGEVVLLDWDTAKAEIVPHYDFNEILRDSKPSQEAFDAFLEGYGMTQADYAEIEPDLLVLNLLRSIDTLRWAIDRAPEVVPQHVKNVQESLDRLGWR